MTSNLAAKKTFTKRNLGIYQLVVGVFDGEIIAFEKMNSIYGQAQEIF
jgi:hypothetical protein